MIPWFVKIQVLIIHFFRKWWYWRRSLPKFETQHCEFGQGKLDQTYKHGRWTKENGGLLTTKIGIWLIEVAFSAAKQQQSQWNHHTGGKIRRTWPTMIGMRIILGDTLWWTNIAIENGHRNSGFSHKKWWFSIAFCMFTRGYTPYLLWCLEFHPTVLTSIGQSRLLMDGTPRDSKGGNGSAAEGGSTCKD